MKDSGASVLFAVFIASCAGPISPASEVDSRRAELARALLSESLDRSRAGDAVGARKDLVEAFGLLPAGREIRPLPGGRGAVKLDFVEEGAEVVSALIGELFPEDLKDATCLKEKEGLLLLGKFGFLEEVLKAFPRIDPRAADVARAARVKVRFLEVGPEDAAVLLDAPASAPPPGRRVQRLSAAEVEKIEAALQEAKGHVKAISGPSVLACDRGTSTLRIGGDRATETYRIVAGKDGKSAEPVVRAVESGWRMTTLPVIREDGILLGLAIQRVQNHVVRGTLDLGAYGRGLPVEIPDLEEEREVLAALVPPSGGILVRERPETAANGGPLRWILIQASEVSLTEKP